MTRLAIACAIAFALSFALTTLALAHPGGRHCHATIESNCH
jgi:hypothetical protein